MLVFNMRKCLDDPDDATGPKCADARELNGFIENITVEVWSV